MTMTPKCTTCGALDDTVFTGNNTWTCGSCAQQLRAKLEIAVEALEYMCQTHANYMRNVNASMSQQSRDALGLQNREPWFFIANKALDKIKEK